MMTPFYRRSLLPVGETIAGPAIVLQTDSTTVVPPGTTLSVDEVARALGIPEIIVPAYPGITSAVGLLTTDLKYDAVRTAFQAGDSIDLDRLNRDLAAMQEELARQLAADGVAAADVAFERSGDLRYVGQGYELRVPFPGMPLDPMAIARRAASGSSRIAPPRKLSGSRRPRTRLASVTVGSVPPRP
jgi:N-methylhydantoinase A/oxoprolinase/acetone carboxylase beta subunit